MCDQSSLEFDTFYYADETVQPNAWGRIHKAPYLSSKKIGYIHTNTTNIYGTVGNEAIVYNESLNDTSGITDHYNFTLHHVGIFFAFSKLWTSWGTTCVHTPNSK